ncbi:MAG: diguanylate cyclase [Ilumatobacter sp.]
MREDQGEWEALISRAQEAASAAPHTDGPSPIDEAIAAETDDGARGSLLLARAIARQGDADVTLASADSALAFELLAANGRVGEAAMAAAAAGALRHRMGDVETAVDYAVEAMVLIDLAERSSLVGRAANTLAVLFAQFSAFEQAMTYSLLASEIFGDDGCVTTFAVPYTHCYVAVEARHAGVEVSLAQAQRAVTQLINSPNELARRMLGPGMAVELALLEGTTPSSDLQLDAAALSGAAPRLQAWYRLVLSEIAHGNGHNENAERLLDAALPVLASVGDDHRVVRSLRLRSKVREHRGNLSGALSDSTALGDSVHTWHINHVGRLAAQISRRAELEKQRTSLERKAARLAEQIDVDALTRVGSRHLLEKRMNELTLQHGAVAIAVFDVDEFKTVNDEHGHAAGDAVLQRLGAVLHSTGTSATVVARHGGDEFIAVFAQCGADVADAFATAVRSRLAEHDWSAISSGLQVSVSVGVADGRLDDVRSVIEQADAALYSAKRLGRDRCITA